MNYTDFAKVYDLLMDDTDYQKIVNYIEKIFNKYKFQPKLILELGCGTGNISIELAKRNYDIIGLDKSIEMLNVAKEKAMKNNQDILFVNQDMTKLDLYGTVDAVCSMVDSINYLTSTNDITKTFKLVNNFLNPKGLFIFDTRTEYYLSHIIGNNTFAENYEDVSYIWGNSYDGKHHISHMELTMFIKEQNGYNKVTEMHQLKAYSIEELTTALSNSGFELLKTYDDVKFSRPKDTSQRIFFVALKK